MKRLLILLCIYMTQTGLPAQQNASVDSLYRFMKHIETFNLLYPQEKVYLHFDNTSYFIGENIWFKAYVINAGNHRSTTGSGILYVELMNSRGILLETKKLKITNGQCHGDFYLTPFNCDYLAGYYEIRAYTKMMLNFGEQEIFSRIFPVFNPPEKAGDYSRLDMDDKGVAKRLKLDLKRKKPEKRKTVNMDFYPEGGYLVNGLTGRVAFKLTDENGLGIEAQGLILDSKGEKTGHFSTFHNGMGIFNILPDGKRYKVQLRYRDRNYTFDLPESTPSGYVLQVNSLMAKNIVLEIRKSPEIHPETLGLSVLCHGKPVFFQALEPDTNTFILRIPKDKLPGGINQITLFDAKGKVFAERLVFIPPGKEEIPYIQAIPSKTVYQARERIKIGFQGVPSAGFSLSVRDAASTIRTTDTGNIQTNLLLSSDLKGFIENPTYYFEKQDASRQQALDILMLVQGWRKYEWKQLAGITPFRQKYDLEKGLKIKGQVLGKADKLIVELALKDSGYLEDTTPVDASGYFSTDIHLDLQGKYYLLMSVPGLKKANLNIRLDRWFSPPPRKYLHRELQAGYLEPEKAPGEIEPEKERILTELEAEHPDSIYKAFEIGMIEVSEDRGKDLIYDVEKDREKAVDLGETYSPLAFDYLVEKNNGFIFKSAEQEIPDNLVATSGLSCWGNFGFHARYMLNEIDWKYISEMDPRLPFLWGNKVCFIELEEIERIVIREWKKELNPKGELCIAGYFYPYEGKIYSVYRKNEAYRVSSFDGYSFVKDFYTGRPEREDYLPGKEEHLRTLYWNPNVTTDKDGRAQVSFYNNAHCRKIEISAEGITNDGTPMVNTNFNNSIKQ